MIIRRSAALFLSCVLCASAWSCTKKSAEEQSSDAPAVTSGVGDLVTPKEGDIDQDLGSYRVSQYGTKLYYEEEQYPTDLMLTLDKYFKSLQEEDFDSYKECLFPSYAEEMEKFLQKDYEYGLDKSFESQCLNLKALSAEEYSVTRIKADSAQTDGAHDDTYSSFFEHLGECFGRDDYYQEVQDSCDKFYDVKFSVMAEFGGEESLIISEREMIMVEKDGKYYNFG